MWITSRSAVSAPDGSLGRATKWTIFENRSTTVMMMLLPLAVGRPVTKSRAMSDHDPNGDGQRAEETSWRTVGGLAVGAVVAGGHKLPCVCLKGGPPEAPADELHRTGGPGVAGQPADVAPLQYLAANCRWDEKAVPGAPSRIGLGAVDHPNGRFNPPGDDTHHPGRREDGINGWAAVRGLGGEQPG